MKYVDVDILSKSISIQDFYVLIWTKSDFQVVPLTAAVIVTTPQKLAFIDVAKGVRMFSKLKVCISAPQYSIITK